MATKMSFGNTAIAICAAVAAAIATSATFSASAATLTHRWSFTSGLTDSVGTKHGVVRKQNGGNNTGHTDGGNVTFSNGEAVLAGGTSAGYVDLGTGLMDSDDATIEIWMTRHEDGGWQYMFAYGICDVSDPGFFTCSYAYGASNDNDRMARPEFTMRLNGSTIYEHNHNYGQFGPIIPDVKYHVSLTFKKNGSDTAVRWVIRNAISGAIVHEKTVTATGWTATATTATWGLTLGHDPWLNGAQDCPSEFDEVRIWNGVLNDDQIAANIVAGPDTFPVGGRDTSIAATGFDIAAGSTFTIGKSGMHWTAGTVSVGAGASIVFDTANYDGAVMKFSTGGFSVPSGSVLDYVQLTDSDDYVASMEDANTVLVRLKSTVPHTSTWVGGQPQSAADLADPYNWESVFADGTEDYAVPGSNTTVVIPATSLNYFSIPDGVTLNWGRVILGGHTRTKRGKYAANPNVFSKNTWIDRAVSEYTGVVDKEISDLYRTTSAGNSPSDLGNYAILRYDGWVHVPASKAGFWKLTCSFDDVFSFALDGDLIIALQTYRYARTSGFYVSEGWHRFTCLAGDTGGGYGAQQVLGSMRYPFVISVNGGSEIAFDSSNFTFGSDSDAVTLTRDCDWRALGEIDVSSGLTIDLNGHNLAVTDIGRSTLGASIVNTSADAAALYVVSPVSTSQAQTSGIASVPIVQYGAKSAIWSGAANDGNPLTPGNWSVTSGAGMVIPGGLPDATTAATIAGANVNMQVPSGSAFQCASLNIVDCTFTADCDWRGLSVTPSITGTADLNGHDLRLSHLSAGGGAALANSGTGISAVKFTADNSTDIFEASHYIDGVANLVTADKARVVIEKGDSSAWNLSAFNVDGISGGYLEGVVSAGSLTSSGSAVTIGANGYGELTVDGGNVTFEKGLNLPGNRAATGILNVKSGSLSVPGYVDFGSSGGHSRIVQSGGTVTMGGSAWFGRFGDGICTYELSGGTFSLQSPGSLIIGLYGSHAQFLQSGGEAIVEKDFNISYNGGSKGLYKQTGGVLTSETEIWVGGGRYGNTVGNGGTGTLDVGGTVNANKGVILGLRKQGVGELILREGGVLNTTFVRKGDGTGAVATFAGGKIVAKDASNASTFISGIGDVIYAAGGLTVDTAGYSVSMTNNTASASLAGSVLVKQGAGTLTVDSLPSVRNVVVDAGTLKLLSDGAGHPSVNAESGNEYTAAPSTAVLWNDYLLHRWNFNGHCYDLIGTNNAVFKGTGTYSYESSNTELKIPGGARGTGWLDCGSNIIPAELGDTPFTIEMWVKVHTRHNWDQWFAFGNSSDPAGTGGALTGLIFAPKSGSGNYPSFRAVGARTSNNVAVGSGNLTENKEYHVAAVVTPTGGSTATVTLYIEDPSGEEEIRVKSENVTNWSTATIVQDNFWLGHSHWGDQDAAASYNEVRVWAAALSQAQVEANGTLGANTLPVLSDCSALDMAECADIASGATLDIAGHTLALPVLKGSGTVRGGMLDITDSLVVNLTDCIAGNCITASGTINFIGAKLVFEDQEVLETHKGSIWLMRPTSGGSAAFIGNLEPASPLPTGWKISISASGARLLKSGLSIHLK